MPFEVTTAVRKMLAMTARKKVVQGATSSGKTYGIIPILYDQAVATPNLKITIVAETIPSLKQGALDIFKNFMYDEGRWDDSCWNATELEYTRANRSRIQFKSFDTEGKAKAAGKRDILFINEANHVSFPIADALMIRSKNTWLDFNADSSFWAHTETLNEPNSEFLKLTYLDNEALPSETLEDLMIKKAKGEAEERSGYKGYWWNWWQVYGLGEIGNLQGVVFSNWTQVDYLPEHANLIGYGMDFGYSNDPTTLVGIYEADGKTYLDELLYRKGMSNADIGNYMKQLEIPRSSMIYADSADPKSIAELRTYGFSVMPAQKGKDSIAYGIQLMQDEYFHVTKRSTNMINELRQYTWLVDKEGKTTNAPIDAFNHCIDGVRYFYQSRRKNTGQYMIR